jgi:hypothetical protein
MSLADSHSGRGWISFLKGGSSSPFFSDISGVLNWFNDGKELKEFITLCEGGGHWSRKIINTDYFYRPGLSWALRTNFFSPHVVPEGCIPSVSRYLAVTKATSPLALMAYLNSPIYDYLVKLTMEKWLQPKFIVSSIKRLPFPTELSRGTEAFVAECSQAVTAKISFITNFEESRYAMPLVNCGQFSVAEIANRLLKNAASSIQARDILVEKATERLYTVFAMSSRDLTQPNVSELSVEAEEEKDDSVAVADASELGIRLTTFAVGCVFGRWDIRYATGERQPPELPNPFDPLPVCPPGMLQNAGGLPTEPKDVPADYPLRISWPGILVDDENHRNKEGHCEDIVARVREAIEVIWKDRAEAIEQEACEILGVKTLREYFRRPAAFFADHLKRYSKSRRQAPIYWPLSTKTGSYTLWLYYHRLTDQTLHTCLADFLDPKIRKVQSELDALTGSGGGGTRASDLRELLDELKDLHDEIERVIKLPWKPNLNDGVLITASPLHKLFRLPKWQKDLKACWDKLAKGEYDWAHLAYSIRPCEVEKACEKDRSIAIAHGLEHLCKVQAPKAKKKHAAKKTAKKKDSDEEEMELDD